MPIGTIGFFTVLSNFFDCYSVPFATDQNMKILKQNAYLCQMAHFDLEAQNFRPKLIFTRAIRHKALEKKS